MKKMPYAIIFIIVLALLVMAGCMSFTPVSGTETTEAESVSADTDTTVSNDVTVPPQTDEDGITVEPVTEDVATTKADSSDEATTKKQDTVTEAPSGATQTGKSEFDIFINGTFYCKGKTTDNTGVTTPMEMAITDNSVYMLAEFEGTEMGIMISDGTTYMLCPEKTSYLELSASILKMMDLDPDELIDSSSLKFDNVKSLDDAKTVTNAVFEGTACKCYFFDGNDGQSRFYISGNKLLGFDSTDTAGKVTTSTTIDTITEAVPAEKSAPPKDYTAYKGITGAVKFMTIVTEGMSLS